MSKQLQTDTVTNELEGSAFFPKKAPRPASEGGDLPGRQEEQAASAGVNDQSLGRLTNRSTERSTDQSTGELASNVVGRPKAFYITRRVDRRLDDAVRYLQEKHGIKRVDRSTIVNAILDNEEMWIEESLDQLVDRVISQLTSRLIK